MFYISRTLTVIPQNLLHRSSNCNFPRQLSQPHELPNSTGAFLAAFYDFQMDGTMDVIITTKIDKQLKMKAYKNLIADDVTFLRVQVTKLFFFAMLEASTFLEK